ncbi:chloride channel protein [Desulfobacula sp.]|uniref:chloride channel protein n=1 Tax=Desulfobacula sp. TaxID=2593537 RepID=UPI0026023405|nr:chloride channel protein [Desulfobacula sp.]
MGFREKVGSQHIAVAGRWLFYFVLIGIIAGCGAIIFHYLCGLGMHYFLDMMAGYRPDAPAGEHLLLPHTQTPFNRWILLFLPALGGLVSGWIVYTFAPEAEGHGTDAAIDAYHHKGGLIRSRVPFIKTIASAITLTTGGSGGREGPIAQIGAGFGSFLATKFKLSERERRIMMAAGIGAGVGSIFRAPLAGALFAAEVLYRDPDFESEVIIPAGISSVVAYCLFCLVFGWGSLFHSPDFIFRNPLELGPYLVLAVILVLTAILYIKVFYGVTDLFKKFSFPNHFKPAVGGLITGIIGFFLPYTLAFGYGITQQAIFNQVAIPTLIALALGKIFTTSFSIGSGGSGGVFGPSIVIGGAMGGAVGKIFHLLIPSVVTSPGSFVIVGMAGFFAAASNTPISTIIFISEMTNSYHLLLPSLLVCSICYLLCQRWTIFENQVKSRIDSPAHAGEFMMDILQTIKVKNLRHLIKEVRCVNEDMPFSEFKKIFSSTKQHYFPVIDRNGSFSGIFSSTDIRGVIFTLHIEQLVVMKDIMVSDLIYTTPSEDLNTVLLKLTQKNIDALPVVDEEDSGHLLGLIYRRDIISHYNDHVRKIKDHE